MTGPRCGPRPSCRPVSSSSRELVVLSLPLVKVSSSLLVYSLVVLSRPFVSSTFSSSALVVVLLLSRPLPLRRLWTTANAANVLLAFLLSGDRKRRRLWTTARRFVFLLFRRLWTTANVLLAFLFSSQEIVDHRKHPPRIPLRKLWTTANEQRRT